MLKDNITLSMTSREMNQIIREVTLGDVTIRIKDVNAWHRYFPNAQYLLLAPDRLPIAESFPKVRHLRSNDLDIFNFHNLHALYICHRNRAVRLTMTDRHFKHLTQLRCLNLAEVNLSSITNEAFQSLPYLESLTLDYEMPTRSQTIRVTDQAFSSFGRLRNLSLCNVSWDLVTENMFAHLSQLTDLYLEECSPTMPLTHLNHLRTLTLNSYTDYIIPNDFFYGLTHLSNLTLLSCALDLKALVPLRNLEILRIGHLDDGEDHFGWACISIDSIANYFPKLLRLTIEDDTPFSDTLFMHFTHLTDLDLSFCKYDDTITEKAFASIPNLKKLNLTGVTNTDITDACFSHLPRLIDLNINFCGKLPLTDLAFSYLTDLKILSMIQCPQPEITVKCWNYLVNLWRLKIDNDRVDTVLDSPLVVERILTPFKNVSEFIFK